jgi:hypothetical protein
LDQLERSKIILERTKLAADIVKHISTLATGSIVIVTTFIDKTHKETAKLYLLSFSVECLMLCLILCAVYLFLVGVPSRWDEVVLRTPPVRLVIQIAAALLYLSFAAGLLALGWFALANI